MESFELFNADLPSWLSLLALICSISSCLYFIWRSWQQARHQDLAVESLAMKYARQRSDILKEVADLELLWEQPTKDARRMQQAVKQSWLLRDDAQLLQALQQIEQFCVNSRSRAHETYSCLINKAAFQDPVLLEQKIPTLYRLSQRMKADRQQIERRLQQVERQLQQSPFYHRQWQQAS